MTKEDAEGRLILSKKRARFELAWKEIERKADSGEPITGKVIEVVKGGLILDLGVRGFLPASLVDIRRVQDLDEFLGQELRCKVIELNRSRNNVVLSRRAVLEDERKEMRQAILDRLNPGDVVDGTISNIVDFGAFVDLDGMDGLIHISELSWGHVNHPSEVLEIGQEVQVKVLDIDRERQRISLGLKQTQSDPWQQVLDSYSVNDVVEGRVTKVVTFGAFVEILPGVEGLVHISELAQHHVENPREVVAQGQVVQVKIIEMDASAAGSRSRSSGSRKARRTAAPRGRSAARPLRRGVHGRRSRAAPRGGGGRGGAGQPSSRPTTRPMRTSRPKQSRTKQSRTKQSGRSRAGRGRAVEAEPDEAELERLEASRPKQTRLSWPRLSRSRLKLSRQRPRRTTTTPRPPRPVRVALTGGIGAGKSEALAAFGRHGAATLSSDEAVHALYEGDHEVRVCARGTLRHGRSGAHRRDRLRRRRELEWLEQLLHPRVRTVSRLARGSRRGRRGRRDPAALRAAAEAAFDAVVVVTAPEELRRARSGAAVDERSARLVPDAEKTVPCRLRVREFRVSRGARRLCSSRSGATA